jgi:hypothetical protein
MLGRIATAGAQTIAIVAFLFLGFLLQYWFGDTYIFPPPHARMVIDEGQLTFASVPCVVSGALERELIKNRDEARDASKPLLLRPYADEVRMSEISARRNERNEHFRRDEKCAKASGFDQYVTGWQRILGFRSRWTEDGEWRW